MAGCAARRGQDLHGAFGSPAGGRWFRRLSRTRAHEIHARAARERSTALIGSGEACRQWMSPPRTARIIVAQGVGGLLDRRRELAIGSRPP